MPISRMLQPRQNYGLGSFVKKAVGKVTKPITKLSKKIVPKEIAGIMRVAAPFLPPGYREAAYLMGTARQTGRISPLDLALVSLPYANKAAGKTDAGFFAEQFPRANQFLFGAPGTDVAMTAGPPVAGMQGSATGIETVGKSTGLFGQGGKMFQFGKDSGLGEFMDQTKLGSFLLENKDKPGTFDKTKLFGLGAAGLSAITAAKTPEEAGEALVAETGNSDDYDRGVELFSQLKPEMFRVPEQFRLADGGRVNYALGSMPTAQESGLGGLPIEADMRYTGGFMPYGAKEKADDVPARLSKNEFVFTADAVRAAGGGSVQKGAQKMYNTMKQLESQPEAKGMMA
jgi:hypothetical protein